MSQIEFRVSDDYPFAAPERCCFSHRLLHVNFGIGLDGTTAMSQLLQFWDAEWGLAKLLRYVRDLLYEPNLSLLPPDYAEGTRHDPALAYQAGPGGDGGGLGGCHSDDLDAPVVGTPADLRRRKGGNRFLAELVWLFCEQRPKYDALARDFCRKYAALPPPPPGHVHGPSPY